MKVKAVPHWKFCIILNLYVLLATSRICSGWSGTYSGWRTFTSRSEWGVGKIL